MRWVAPCRIQGFIKRDMKRLHASLIAAVSFTALAQTTSRPEEQLETETARRIESLTGKFRDLMEPAESEKQWAEACNHLGCGPAAPGIREAAERAGAERDKAMGTIASQIHSGVDTYIARGLRLSYVDPQALQQSLTRILGKTAWGPTSAFVINVNEAPSLVVAYTLAKGGRMGSGATSVTVRAYGVAEGSFRLVATAGSDMDGYADVSLVQLHSPMPNEMWVLLSGYMTGANGPNNEMRIYAYDGAKFRTVWKDDNWGDFTVRTTDRGFTVDGPYYREAAVRHDVYLLAEDGVRLSSR
jgi:hypothetical protein